MLREWVHFALTDTGFLQGIFLASCRHLIVNNYQKEFFVEVASSYKMACVRNVINAINSKDIDMDATFATIFILAFDEVREHRMHILASRDITDTAQRYG